MNLLINLLLHATMVWRRFILWPAFTRKLNAPDQVQQAVLQSILQRNSRTRFGEAHQFATITSPAEYALRVPLQTYEDLRPYIERQQQGSPGELTSEEPLLFAQTSGTTGKPKYIPILQRSIDGARENQRLFSYGIYSAIPGLFAGKSLGFVSPAIEGKLPSGIPYGSMSGLIYRTQPWLLRRKYVVPAAVFEINDYELKYFIIAAFALAEPRITYIGAANPSTFVKIADVIRNCASRLQAALETGELPGLDRVAPDLARQIKPYFKPHPRRAVALQTLLAAPSAALFSGLWPDLKALSCWREGSCRVVLPAVRKLLNPAVPLLELGYLSSEARGSLPVAPLEHREAPTLHQNYFEFIERSDWESGRPMIKTLAQLEIGRAYYVIITTPSGLYRYFMNDVITVDGRWKKTPTIKFVEKGAGVTSITGEKLYESQVIAAASAALAQAETTAAFFVMVADEENQRYRFYLEAPFDGTDGLMDRFEAELSAQNLEYKAKRLSGRLGPTALKILQAGTSEAFKAHFIAKGQREAQFKFIRLHTRARLTFNLDAHVVEETP